MTIIISFGEVIDDWGAANWIVRALLEHATNTVGTKAYLKRMIASGDHCHGIEFNELDYDDSVEFLSIMESFLTSGAYRELVPEESLDQHYSETFADLVGKIEMYVKSRRPN